MQGHSEIDIQNKRQEKFTMLLARSAQILCEDRKHGDHFNYHPINGSSILRLHLLYKKKDDLELLFLFPRRPEYKNLYKDARTWFAAEGLEWKDRTVNGERYMGATIPRIEPEIIRLIRSFQAAIFDYDVLLIKSENTKLTFKLMNMSMGLFSAAALLIMGSVSTFLVYQITQLGQLGRPSPINITSYEWAIMAIFYATGISLKFVATKEFNQNYNQAETPKKKPKRIKQLLFFTLPALIASMTG